MVWAYIFVITQQLRNTAWSSRLVSSPQLYEVAGESAIYDDIFMELIISLWAALSLLVSDSGARPESVNKDVSSSAISRFLFK